MRRLLIPATFALLTLLFFNALVVGGLILARGDTFTYFYPYWAARDAALSAGQIPLWTPDLYMGAPLLANPQLGTLYPPNWISLLLDLDAPGALRLALLLHVGWAGLGAYVMARWHAGIDVLPALITGLLFGFGGYIGGHVEQINQLQGLAWMPWAFAAYSLALERSLRYAPLLAVAFAMQVLSGHTQTVFITGVGLGLFALVNVLSDIRALTFFPEEDGPDWRRTLLERFLRSTLVLGLAVAVAAVLALPQLLPTLELTGLSNRGGGFNVQQAMAFSWNPALAARALLPSYDAQLFSEYVVSIGVLGGALAFVGAFSRETGKLRVIWVVVALMGLFLALGAFNPVYWTLAGLPGFNWFRVPARWLALFALGGAMLAGLGAHMLLGRARYIRERESLLAIGSVVLLLGLAAAFITPAATAAEIDGPAQPTLVTVLAWLTAYVVFINIVLLRRSLPRPVIAALILTAVSVELFAASRVHPYNDVVDPLAWDDPRLTLSLLRSDTADAPPSESRRVLGISPLLFDPGDKAALTLRFDALNMSDRASQYGFTAAKLKEVASPNLTLPQGITSVDGFGGGVLPSIYYTQYTALLLPSEAQLRTIDGRLRENLALPACRGACLPDSWWLDHSGVHYLVIDKTYDPWQDDVNYDTTFHARLNATETRVYAGRDVTANEARLLIDGVPPLLALDDGPPLSPARVESGPEPGTRVAVYTLKLPTSINTVRVQAVDRVQVLALTLVDTRDGSFAPLTPPEWTRYLSSDVKLYARSDPLHRAVVLHDAAFVSDDYQGGEDALALMTDSAWDPARQLVLHLPHSTDAPPVEPGTVSRAVITEESATRIEIHVESEVPGLLRLNDAYYPGWQALVNWQPAPLHRADVMFRAVPVPAGESIVVLEYRPNWFPGALLIGAGAWLLLLIGGIGFAQRVPDWQVKPFSEQPNFP